MERSGQTAACHHPNPRTHHLDTGHKGPRNERGPKESCSEQRSGRRVGRYSGGIVIRCASNYTWTKVREEPFDRVLRMSRWILVGIGVLVWSLASGGTGLAQTFGILLLTRAAVGIGEGGYGPVAPTIIAESRTAAAVVASATATELKK